VVSKSQQQVAAFAFGIVFIVTLLTLAITVPEPTAFQYMVFRIVLALASGGIAAMIPGFLHVEISEWVRAGGALAVFVIVYFYNPAALVRPDNVPMKSVEKAVRDTPAVSSARTTPESTAGSNVATHAQSQAVGSIAPASPLDGDISVTRQLSANTTNGRIASELTKPDERAHGAVGNQGHPENAQADNHDTPKQRTNYMQSKKDHGSTERISVPRTDRQQLPDTAGMRAAVDRDIEHLQSLVREGDVAVAREKVRYTEDEYISQSAIYVSFKVDFHARMLLIVDSLDSKLAPAPGGDTFRHEYSTYKRDPEFVRMSDGNMSVAPWADLQDWIRFLKRVELEIPLKHLRGSQ
jgi:hypothetical protein